MKTIIKLKFNKPIGILTPQGASLAPSLYPTHSQDTPVGPAVIHEYNFDEIYTVNLLEEDKPIPKHVEELGPEVKNAFLQTFAKELAENHAANEAFREALKHHEASGTITVLSDTFRDRKGKSSKEAINESQKTQDSQTQETQTSPSRKGKRTP